MQVWLSSPLQILETLTCAKLDDKKMRIETAKSFALAQNVVERVQFIRLWLLNLE